MARKPTGKPNGRPPKYGTTEELIALGEEMMQWINDCKSKKLNIVHLSQFYSEIKDMDRDEWRSIRVRGCFLPYYKKALDWMIVRTLTNDKLPTAYGSRFLNVYSDELREIEREIAREKVSDEIELKRADAIHITEKDMLFNQALMDAISRRQEERKSDLNNKSSA